MQEITEKGTFSDYRTFGLSALRTIGPSDYRAVTLITALSSEHIIQMNLCPSDQAAKFLTGDLNKMTNYII